MAFSLFGRKEPPKPKTPEPPSLPRAVAFVDYESWYVSLKTTYAISPDISGWFAELNQQYQLVEVTFFADFSRKCYADELRRIRPYTNKIIDTRSPNGVEKDYTDFILLDNLYQKALSATDIQTFILFSGDGHFGSAVAFLKNFYHKEVVVYGIRDCFSHQLQESASRVVTLPNETQINSGLNQSVFEYLRRSAAPTYDGALRWMTERHKNVSRQTLAKALELLEKRGVLSQHAVEGNRQKQLFVNWDSAEPWLETTKEELFAKYPVPDLHENRPHQNPAHFALKNSENGKAENPGKTEKGAQNPTAGNGSRNGKQGQQKEPANGNDRAKAEQQKQAPEKQGPKPAEQKQQTNEKSAPAGNGNGNGKEKEALAPAVSEAPKELGKKKKRRTGKSSGEPKPQDEKTVPQQNAASAEPEARQTKTETAPKNGDGQIQEKASSGQQNGKKQNRTEKASKKTPEEGKQKSGNQKKDADPVPSPAAENAEETAQKKPSTRRKKKTASASSQQEPQAAGQKKDESLDRPSADEHPEQTKKTSRPKQQKPQEKAAKDPSGASKSAGQDKQESGSAPAENASGEQQPKKTSSSRRRRKPASQKPETNDTEKAGKPDGNESNG